MPLTIATWNIEKNGQSSALDKQTKVSHFIDMECNQLRDVIFLCEVHSARVDDYANFLRAVYGTHYGVYVLEGGYSNNYVCLIRSGANISDTSYYQLQGLNRAGLMFRWNSIWVVLAHFKSGQNGLTRNQLQNAADFLESLSPGYWAIMGDMNWDYARLGELAVPIGTHADTMWADQTQVRGGILDWCLAGRRTGLASTNGYTYFVHYPELINMLGPDHRPVIFKLWET